MFFIRIAILMMMLFLSSRSDTVQAQQDREGAFVKGVLINARTKEPVPSMVVRIPYLKRLTVSGEDGSFVFQDIPFETYTLVIGNSGLQDTLRVFIDKPFVDLGELTIYNDPPVSAQAADVPAFATEAPEPVPDEADGGSRRVSSPLGAGRDPFQNTAAYTFSSYRFRIRGYRTGSQKVLINGALMNDMETGEAYWSNWGGLNDAFRKNNATYGLFPAGEDFGTLTGTASLDAVAASQRKQTKLTWSLTNRLYRNRIMLTHNSGSLPHGWAYAVSVSKRWAKEGYIEGTFYDGYACYAAVSKQWGKKHLIGLTAFGASSRSGKAAPVTAEITGLTGTSFYNPNWGYQNGKMRNAKTADHFQPVVIFNYEYHPSFKLRWNTALSYQWGKNKNASLDWYNGSDPRPDYYRYLPSWQLLLYNTDPALGALRAQTLSEEWRNEPARRQLDWDRLYNVNYSNLETITNINGNPSDSLTGHRSVYVQSNDVDDVKRLGFNTVLQAIRNERLSLSMGLSLEAQQTESYRQLIDLLGGDFFINLNQFAARAYQANSAAVQNDLDHPGRVIRQGDKYAYDYLSHFGKGSWWGQTSFSFNKLDIFVAASLGVSTFQREGLYRNGLAPGNSLGKDEQHRFTTYGFKAGLTYKFNGRNYVFINGRLSQDAPFFDNTYIAPRTRNLTVDGPSVQNALSAEAGYLLRAPRVNARVVGYVTDIKHVMEIKRFYSDDERFRSFVNYAFRDMTLHFTGLELALDVKVNALWNITAVAASGQAFYANRPDVLIYNDNDTASVPMARQVFIKNYYLAVGPQSAYALVFNYQSRQYWYGSLSFNYFDRNYVEVSPDRRTQETADLVVPGSERYHRIFDQERLPAAFTVDLFLGKSFLLSKFFRFLPRNTFLYFNLGVNNLMGKTDLRTGGFEQLRYDFGRNSPASFPPKYFYSPGRNYFLNLSLKI